MDISIIYSKYYIYRERKRQRERRFNRTAYSDLLMQCWLFMNGSSKIQYLFYPLCHMSQLLLSIC